MENTFLQIVEEHQNIIYKVCRMYRDSTEDQEDLFQEIVLQLWRSFPGFRGDAKVSSWMYRIALNTAIAVFRKKRVTLDFKETIADNLPQAPENSPSENGPLFFQVCR